MSTANDADPAVAHLPESAQRGFEALKSRRVATQLGSAYWTPDRLCQATAKSSGKQCRGIPVSGQRYCTKHGGHLTAEARERRRRRNAGKPTAARVRQKSIAQKSLDMWSSNCQRTYGGARAAVESLSDGNRRQALYILESVWEHAKYQNKKGWRAAAWIVIKFLESTMELSELKRHWSLIDPGVAEHFAAAGLLDYEASSNSLDTSYGIRRTRPTPSPSGRRIDGVEFGGVPYEPARRRYGSGNNGGW
jgi:hypothetical protein